MPNYNSTGGRLLRTQGKAKRPVMSAEQKITKARLDAINPYLWQHLDAASKGKRMSHGLKR